jgi:hypothetical protein
VVDNPSEVIAPKGSQEEKAVNKIFSAYVELYKNYYAPQEEVPPSAPVIETVEESGLGDM